MKKFKERMSSDKAAAGGVETILLIGLAIFAALVIQKWVMAPFETKAKAVGVAIGNY